MPEFQRLVIWLHSVKKIVITKKRRTNNLCKSIKLKEKKFFFPIPEQSHIRNVGYLKKKKHIYFNTHLCELRKSITL